LGERQVSQEGPDRLISAAACSELYKVEGRPVNARVTQLKSVPELGYEHAAYRVETGDAVVWIDCPSAFDANVALMNYILFTHSDFLGASNLYRHQFGTQVWIHARDAAHPNSRLFPFDHCFDTDFQLSWIEAVIVSGHTPRYTLYFFADVLFICDYVDRGENELAWNAYGNCVKTKQVGQRIHQILNNRTDPITTVCSVDYVCEYSAWKDLFDRLVAQL
jgi:hydroxyacylglutathione hydrolase